MLTDTFCDQGYLSARDMPNVASAKERLAKMRKAPVYPATPRNLSGGISWFYEQPTGLIVVGELRSLHSAKGEYYGTTQVKIPWSKLCLAVDNHRAVQAAKRKPARLR